MFEKKNPGIFVNYDSCKKCFFCLAIFWKRSKNEIIYSKRGNF